MNLYAKVHRIHNELRALGIGDRDPLSVDVLSRFDQYHYFGTDAVDEAITSAGITAASRVLDVGSGLGGPARYLADRAGCHVTAIELQSDLHDLGESLTQRCGLEERVSHINADFLTFDVDVEVYDVVVSWLCFYHIADHRTLFSQIHAALKPGGQLYVEDLFRHGDFAPEEMTDLREMIFGQCLPMRDEYVDDLGDAGFGDIHFDDRSDLWKRYVEERVEGWNAARSGIVQTHGEATYESLSAFYRSVSALFGGGNLGGVRILASKPR